MTFDRWPQPETLRAAPDYTIGQLQAAMAEGQILTGQAVHCDAALNLHIRLGALSGIMPRGECVAPFLSGAQREIAVLSCVGRGVCCRVTGQRTAPNGDTELLLSRRLAQEEAMDYIEAHAEPGLVIPGLAENLIPQGMDQCDETGILYISGYYTTDGKSSAILAVDTATGELTAEYILLNAGGTPFDGHVGGVAVSEDTLYVSGQKQNGLYTICAIPLKDLPAEGSHEVKLEQTIPVPVSPSFLSCSHGYLWVGNFYHPGADYPLSDGMKYTTASADGEDYGCYIMGYDLSKGSLSVADGDDYAQPDLVLVGPNKIQGVVVGEDDTVTLSQSYGRKNNASLLRYSLALGETLDTMLTVQGRDVPGYILDSKRLKESVTAMPMTEALADAKDGGIYVLFESGAIHYANGTFRTDHVWKIKF